MFSVLNDNLSYYYIIVCSCYNDINQIVKKYIAQLFFIPLHSMYTDLLYIGRFVSLFIF